MQGLGLSAELGLWDVIKGSKGYLVPTALPLTLDVAGAMGCGAWLPFTELRLSYLQGGILGPDFKRVLRADNSHIDSFGTGSLGCA